jgi:hypothetical protein
MMCKDCPVSALALAAAPQQQTPRAQAHAVLCTTRCVLGGKVCRRGASTFPPVAWGSACAQHDMHHTCTRPLLLGNREQEHA